MSEHSAIGWTNATCRDCGVSLMPENRVEHGRNLCKPCKKALAASAGCAVFVKQDSGLRPGKQGRLSDALWARKEYPVRVSA